MAESFDAIVVGTGQAGPALAARLVGAGMKVAVAERNRFGGTCVNTGCVPTKALVASAYAAQLARRAAEYGVTIAGPVTVDMKRVKARTDEISGNSSKRVEKWMRGLAGARVFNGHARLEGSKRVSVDGAQLEAERIFLDVGGRALIPPIAGLTRVPYLTNATVLDLDQVPEHLLILGASYIGLEFGQMYRRFGAQVTIIERASRPIFREDEDVSRAVREILEREGVAFVLESEVVEAKGKGGQLAVTVQRDGQATEIDGSHILVAVGRRPNTDDLGLQTAGVDTDRNGYITVDDELRTSAPGIWALGECNGRGAFTHTAYNDYEIVAANLLDGEPRRVSDRITAYGLFTDPPLGRFGMTEAEVRRSGRKALVGTRPMRHIARAVEKGETQGFVKILVDADTRQILGASILGVGGDEAIHSLLDIAYARAPYTTVTHAMHIHPTVSELLPTILQDLRPLT
jgi:pyruvate/2-oxoglutarate dehydrogenase complex dihydrolipoamide dehydrogenase (E3) component